MLYYSANLLKVKMLYIIPLLKLFTLILHSISVSIIVKIIQLNLLKTLPLIVQLIFSFSFFYILLVLTSKYFKIEYKIIYVKQLIIAKQSRTNKESKTNYMRLNPFGINSHGTLLKMPKPISRMMIKKGYPRGGMHGKNVFSSL